MQSVDLLLHNATIITMDANYTVHAQGGIAISGSDIVALGADVSPDTYTATTTIDCHGQVILPGLVNAHTHVPMTLLRGLNDDLRLDVWLGYLMPLEREFVTPEFVKLGTRLACAEMLLAGVTTFADMYYFEEAVAEETAKAGLRALLGQTILVFPAPDAQTYEDGLERCRKFIEEWNGHELIQPAVAPHAWYTATPEMTRACADLARAYDVPIHTHVSETSLEAKNSREQNEMPVVPFIAQQGVLDTKLLAAHCVHLEKSEMRLLKQANAGVAHCPTSNLKLASGIAQVDEMLDMGLNVGVGTDGPASNNDLDMFEEMRLAALLAKAKTGDPTAVPARTALQMATSQGAKAVHMGDITGSLEVGKRADLIMVDMQGAHNQPQFHNNPDTIYSRLIYAAKSTDVQHVVCNGRLLLQNRQLLTIDLEETLAEAEKMAQRIDTFVQQREANPYHKLVLLEGVTQQECFEVQIKVPLESYTHVKTTIEKEAHFAVTKSAHYKQYDHYFWFEDGQGGTRLRHREDVFVDEAGTPYQERARLTLIGETNRHALPNAVMLSRSRFLAQATRTVRFYREYFAPQQELEVHKERLRWRVIYEKTEFAINLDEVIKPKVDGYYLEIKARTWSRTDAARKGEMIHELLGILGVDAETAVRQEYAEIVNSHQS